MANRDVPTQNADQPTAPGDVEADPYDFGQADLPDLPNLPDQTDVMDAEVTGSDRTRITLAEETLEPRVVRKQIGEVVIHKSIETQTLRNEVDLHREQVAIEQMVIEEIVDEKREPWYEDDMLVIPVYEEVLVTERKLMLTRLVRVRRDVTIEHTVVEGDVRREVLDIEPRSAGR